MSTPSRESQHEHWSDEETVLTRAARLFAWLFGIFFLLAGLVSMRFLSPVVGLGYILAGVIALPPSRAWLSSKTGWNISGGATVIAVIVIIFLMQLLTLGDTMKRLGGDNGSAFGQRSIQSR